jgi:hypothetical protein
MTWDASLYWIANLLDRVTGRRAAQQAMVNALGAAMERAHTQRLLDSGQILEVPGAGECHHVGSYSEWASAPGLYECPLCGLRYSALTCPRCAGVTR